MLSPSTDLPPTERPLDRAAVVRIVLGIMLPMLLGALDMTIVVTALPAMGADFGDFDNVAWVMTGYLLASTVVTPIYGKLSDLYGRRAMMLIAIVVVMIGSVVSALAPTLLVLIVGRVIQGLGGGGTLPLAQTIIAEITTPRERPRYQAYTSSMFISATIFGPVVGGFIADHMHWSVIFWINLPLGVLAFVSAAIVLRALPRHDRPHQLDILGALLMMFAGVTLMLALNWGGKRYAWVSPEIGGLTLASVALWATFAWRVMSAPEPFVPLSVLSDRIVRNSTGLAFFGVGTTIGLTVLIPLYLKIGLGLSATLSGLAVIAIQGGATVASIGASWLIVRMVRYRRVPLAGTALAAAFLLVLALAPSGLSMPTLIAVITMVGVGLGPIFPMTIITIQNVIAPRQLGIATGVMGFFRMLGGTMIVASFNAILIGGAVSGAAPGDAGAVDAEAFRWIFVAAIGFLAVAACFLCGIEEKPFRGPELLR